MKLFRKPIKDNRQEGKKIPSAVGAIYAMILSVQRKVSDWLGRQSEKLSPAGKRISLLLFGLLMGGVSLTLIINSIRNTYVDASVLSRTIESPIYSPRADRDLLLTQEEYKKLVHFRKMMDSLKQSPGGTALYEEILQGRTGLLDSVDFLLGIR